jgi:hypothetical protein
MEGKFKKYTITICLAVCCFLIFGSSTLAATDPTHAALVRFAERIVANQMSDGAIIMGDPSFPPPFEVVPYFSNLAAYGLMRAYEITSNPKYLASAQAWAGWYLAHQNIDGTIYDFYGTAGHWNPTYDYDSTDSYASTFLEVAQKILLYTSSTATISQSLLQSVPGLLAAQQLTMQPDGLTLAKPGYDFAYTEDNIEVYRGMIAAAAIHGWNRTGRQDPAYQAENTRYAIESILFETRIPAHYSIGITLEGTVEDISKLNNWYPDQQVQLMAIAWLPATTDNIKLYTYMKKHFYGALPLRIANEDQLDQIVWWSMSAQNMTDPTIAQQLISRLTGYTPKTPFYNVGLNGHVCRILADSIRK